MLKLKLYTNLNECGTDEAGRGCLAGPVTAAAVILPDTFNNKLLNDSKKLSASQREKLLPIIEQEAVAYGIAHIMMEEIDKINILNASILGMHRSIDELLHMLSQERTQKQSIALEHILVDGNKFKPYRDIDHTCVIKGDGKYLPIAAASVLAKTARDAYMKTLHEEFPMYNWAKNKGYPTQEHRDAIRKYGISPYHRKSFRLLPEQYVLDFEK